MAINTIYRLRTQGSYFGQRVEWGVHLQQTAGGASSADLAAHWNVNLMPALAAATSVSVSWDRIVVSDVSPGQEVTYILSITPATPGTVTGDALPPQNASVLRLNTLVKGKRSHGRVYIPGLSETNVANATISGTQLTSLTSLGSALLTNYGPSGTSGIFHLVVYSPPTRPFVAPKPPPVHTNTVITPINSVSVDPVVRTMRRRALGVGR